MTKDSGCFNCGADKDHFIEMHNESKYTCDKLQEIDSEEYSVYTGLID